MDGKSSKKSGNNTQKAPHPNQHSGLAIGLSSDECTVAESHPQLKNNLGYLVKGEMDREKQEQFKKWRSGPKYASLSDPQKALADKLQQMIEQRSDELLDRKQPSSQSIQSSKQSGKTNQKTSYSNAAHPSVLGSPFHNPYTFIPFGSDPIRRPPTPLSIGDLEPQRRSGVLLLTIRTLSPLLSCNALPDTPEDAHKTYRALSIDQDVIVPATGVKGSLRSLMTVLAGGNLGYVDETLFLTQDRDLFLGPPPKNNDNAPKRVFLAEIVEPGSAYRSGTIRLGKTLLVSEERLKEMLKGNKLPRPKKEQSFVQLWADARPSSSDPRFADVSKVSEVRTEECKWKIKLSGAPVGKKKKCEGLFLPDENSLEIIPAKLWAEYQGRHRHSDHPALKQGDLVWLELDSHGAERIEDVSQIISLQWARWGRKGESLLSILEEHHKAMIPDALRNDGLVDEVTDLFGHVPNVRAPHAAPAFRGRIRPENLVFLNSKKYTELVALSPLANPHPGCAGFYRDAEDFDDYGPNTPLRGYKVYRNTTERGSDAPWNYAVQPIYDNGRPKQNGNSRQKLNKSVELLREGLEGKLRITVNDLSEREFSMLLLACSVDWRLGGGKPLGLGHCRVVSAEWVDELGNRNSLFTRLAQTSSDYPPPADLGDMAKVVEDLAERVKLWHESQRPVKKLRYPRASEQNKNSVVVGGHQWFGRHASKRKGAHSRGIPVLHLEANSELSNAANGKTQILPQPLPQLDATGEGNDVLFGYDLHLAEANKADRNNQKLVKKLETYDEKKHGPK